MKEASDSYAADLERYYDQCWKNTRKRLKAVTKKDTEEAIHKARVAIKKMVALFSLLAWCDGGRDERKALRPLVRISKLLSHVRDHTNALKLCDAHQIATFVLRHEAHKAHSAAKKISLEIAAAKSDLKHIKKKNKQRLPAATFDKWRLYLHERRDQIYSILTADPGAEQLHEARKLMKELLYNLTVSAGAGQAIVTKRNVAKLSRQEEYIGQWHDVLLFRQKLQQQSYDSRHPHKYAAVKSEEATLKKRALA